jgi:tape measure domain-containing protein
MAKEYVLSAIIKVLDKASGPLQKIGQGFGAFGVNVGKASANLESTAKRVDAFGSRLSTIGGSLTTGLTLPILGTGIAALKVFGDMEMLTAQFTTMFGGSEAAAKSFLAQIEKYADVTPYTTASLAKNAQTMMSFGMSAEDTMATLKRLGDIAGGNNARMDQLSLAFAQVSASGRLMGQDLLQMINAGFNPLQIMSKNTGKSMAQLKDEMSRGEISAQMVSDAFKQATAEGGLFYKGAERGSKTLFGLFSTLKDTGEKSLRVLGEAIKDSFQLSENIPKFAARITKLTASLAAWIKAHPTLTKYIMKTALALAILGPALIVVGKAIKTVSATMSVFSLLGTGISKLPKIVTGIRAIANATWFWNAAQKAVNLSFKAMPLIALIALIIYAAKKIREAVINWEEWGAGMMAMSGTIGGMVTNIKALIAAIEALKGGKTIGEALSILNTELTKGTKQVGSGQTVKGYNEYEKRKKLKEKETGSDPYDINKIINGDRGAADVTIKLEAEKGTGASLSNVRTKGDIALDLQIASLTGPNMKYGHAQ